MRQSDAKTQFWRTDMMTVYDLNSNCRSGLLDIVNSIVAKTFDPTRCEPGQDGSSPSEFRIRIKLDIAKDNDGWNASLKISFSK